MRHTDIGINAVIDAIWTQVIFIKRSQVGVEPLWLPRSGNERQVRRSRTKPNLGVAFVHAVGHERAQFDFGIKDQIGFVQIFRDTEISRDTVVPGILQ